MDLPQATNRLRNVKGQFQSTGPQSDESIQRKENRRIRTAKNRNIGKQYFEYFAEVTFLPGDAQDYIPADGDSPLMSLAKALIKEKYIPGYKERIAHLRFLYFDHKGGTKQEDVKTASIIDGSHVDGRKVRRRIFKKRRLPTLSRVSNEMHKLKLCILDGIKRGILKVESYESAYEITRSELGRYQTFAGKYFYYKDYPPAVKQPGDCSSAPNEAAESTPRNRTARLQVDGNDRQQNPTEHAEINQSNLSSIVSGPLCSGCTSLVNSSCSQTRGTQHACIPTNSIASTEALWNGSAFADESEDDRAMAVQVSHVFETARKDTLFFLLCNAVDEKGGSQLHIIGHNLLSKCSKALINIEAQLRDTIQYVVEKNFGTKDVVKFRALERDVLLNMHSLKLARRCLGLTPYESMEWNEVMRSENFLPSEMMANHSSTRVVVQRPLLNSAAAAQHEQEGM